MYRLRVLVAENHQGLRRAVVELLRSQFDVVGEVGDGEQLVQAAIQDDPDVIVSDIAMPIMDGFSAMNELRSRLLEVPFVFMTLPEISGVPPILEGEPLCYVHKADLGTELNLAVQAAADGHSYMSRSFRKN